MILPYDNVFVKLILWVNKSICDIETYQKGNESERKTKASLQYAYLQYCVVLLIKQQIFVFFQRWKVLRSYNVDFLKYNLTRLDKFVKLHIVPGVITSDNISEVDEVSLLIILKLLVE